MVNGEIVDKTRSLLTGTESKAEERQRAVREEIERDIGQNSEKDGRTKGERDEGKKRAHARHPLGWTGRMRAIPYRWHTVFPCLYGYLLVLPLALPHLLDLSSFSLYSASFFLNFVSIPSFIHFLFFFFPSLSVSRSIFVFIFF